MNIKELEETTGSPRRLIRYLIAKGIVPSPDGKTLGAVYDDRHVAAIRAYQRVKERNIGLADVVRALGPEPENISVMPGVSLSVDPVLLRDVGVERIVDEIKAALGAHAARKMEEFADDTSR